MKRTLDKKYFEDIIKDYNNHSIKDLALKYSCSEFCMKNTIEKLAEQNKVKKHTKSFRSSTMTRQVVPINMTNDYIFINNNIISIEEIVEDYKSMKLEEIAEYYNIPINTVNTLKRKLRRKGYIERTFNPFNSQEEQNKFIELYQKNTAQKVAAMLNIPTSEVYSKALHLIDAGIIQRKLENPRTSIEDTLKQYGVTVEQYQKIMAVKKTTKYNNTPLQYVPAMKRYALKAKAKRHGII